MPDQVEDFGIAKKLVGPASEAPKPGENPRPAGESLPPTPVFLRSPAQPASPAPLPRPAPGYPAGSRETAVEPRKLIVGPGITVSGEIASCDSIVVEGNVQANMQGCQHMTITSTGLFDGTALINEAEVHGRFEGDLTVRNRLWVRATGQVSGTIHYGQIEIEAGGRISGSVESSRS